MCSKEFLGEIFGKSFLFALNLIKTQQRECMYGIVLYNALYFQINTLNKVNTIIKTKINLVSTINNIVLT